MTPATGLEPYFSRTGTRRNLALLRAAGWSILISAAGPWRTEGFDRWGVDNGAWTAHQRGTPWDAGRFAGAIEAVGAGAQWIVAPDIVGGGLASLRLTERWLPRLDGVGRRRLIAVQDGLRPDDVADLVGPEVGLAVGGSTDWKLSTLSEWGAFARERDIYLHVLRVNSGRRIAACSAAGAHSFDGTSCSRFAVTVARLDANRRQLGWTA